MLSINETSLTDGVYVREIFIQSAYLFRIVQNNFWILKKYLINFLGTNPLLYDRYEYIWTAILKF